MDAGNPKSASICNSFSMPYDKVVLVTGCSSGGIGLAL